MKLEVFNPSDPEIGIVFEYTPPRTEGKAQGWHGKCTECGKPCHYWNEEKVYREGQKHVNSHFRGGTSK
jgi:hypothetical protein